MNNKFKIIMVMLILISSSSLAMAFYKTDLAFYDGSIDEFISINNVQNATEFIHLPKASYFDNVSFQLYFPIIDEIYYNTSFENDDWNNHLSASAPFANRTTQKKIDGNYSLLLNNSGGDSYVRFNTTPDINFGEVTIEFNFYQGSPGVDIMRLYAADKSAEYSAYLRWSTSYIQQDLGSWVNVAAYSALTWYKFKIIINATKIEYYLDDVHVNTTDHEVGGNAVSLYYLQLDQDLYHSFIDNLTISYKTNRTANVSIYAGNKNTVHYISSSVRSPYYENVSLNITAMNRILEEECTCINCSLLAADYCKLPLIFGTEGNDIVTLNITDLNISYKYGVDNCSNSLGIDSNATTLNITFYNPDNVVQNIDFESTFLFWNNLSEIHNYSNEENTINYTEFCIYPAWANISSNIQTRYTYETIIYDYFTFNTQLNNLTKSWLLYTQNGTTQVLFTVLDTDTNPVANAYIYILRYDVGTGTYTTTEILKTDSQGQALGNIVLGTTFYNFQIYYLGSLVYTEQEVKLLATTRTFTLGLGAQEWYDDYENTIGVAGDVYFNDDTNNFVFTWSDPTGDMHYGCLRVDKQNVTNKTTLYDACTLSTSATITYNIAKLHNGSMYTGTGYLKYDNENIIDIAQKYIEAARAQFRDNKFNALFIAFLFNLALVMIGLPNPVIAMSFLSVGLIISLFIGMIQFSMISLGSIIVLIIIQIFLAGRQTK